MNIKLLLDSVNRKTYGKAGVPDNKFISPLETIKNISELNNFREKAENNFLYNSTKGKKLKVNFNHKRFINNII